MQNIIWDVKYSFRSKILFTDVKYNMWNVKYSLGCLVLQNIVFFAQNTFYAWKIQFKMWEFSSD